MSELTPVQITALCDTREKQPLDLAPLQIEVATLHTADYSVKGLEHVIAIERKSKSDLFRCVGADRERFDRQVQRMLGYPVRAMIVEASWSQLEMETTRGKLTSAQVVGSCLGWIARGLPIIMAVDRRRAGRYISRLLYIAARRRWRENHTLMEMVATSCEER